MNYKINEYGHKQYIHIQFFGEIGDEALMKYLDDAFLIPAFGSKDQLADYSDVTKLLLTTPGIFKFCRKINDYCKAWPHQHERKVAIVIPNKVAQFAGLMESIFLKEIQSLRHAPEHESFRSIAEALEWLGVINDDDDISPKRS